MRTASAENIVVPGGQTGVTATCGVGGAVSRLYGVYLVYDIGAPATTVFTLKNLGRTFFTSAAGNTNTYYPILETAYGTNGAALTTGNPYVECVVSGTITIQITSATPGNGYGALFFLYDD